MGCESNSSGGGVGPFFCCFKMVISGGAIDLWGGVEGGLMVRGCFGDERVEWGALWPWRRFVFLVQLLFEVEFFKLLPAWAKRSDLERSGLFRLGLGWVFRFGRRYFLGIRFS